MAKFLSIGYGDEAGYRATSESVIAKAHANDAELQSDGAIMGIAGTPVQVRNHDGAGTETTEGPYLKTDLPVAGFALIEADSLEEAIAKLAASPCAVAQGVIEIWPLK